MDKQSFEEALEKLEGIVKELESGELPLEEAVKKYEEGTKLAKHCHNLLENAEKALTKKMEDGGEVDFETTDAEDGE